MSGSEIDDAYRAAREAEVAASRAEINARMAEYQARDDAFSRRKAEILPLNKAALFAALAAAGIATVVVEFDGSGDSGQIESITGFNAENAGVEVPEGQIEIQEVIYVDATIAAAMQAPREVIECMAYDLLSQTHGGWENDDGGYGAFTFDVAEQSIALDFNQRFTDSTSYSHQF